MFIQTEATPNPATLKFLPGRVVLAESTFEAKDAESAARSPLASSLFAVPGVSGVYFGHDFISVTKAEGESEWPQVKPAVLGAIMEHFQSGAPVLAEGVVLEEGSSEEFYDEADHDTVVTIKDLLETRVRPAVASDGGDITFRGYKEGVVYLEMKGACSGCPSSTATLRQGVQNLFRHFLPSVREVQAI
ncbi:NifU family protein [Methylobacterium haplocladii]|uniref:Iron transporter n=1 Tax=Methylobacterium haplocladii TaxID=1176176 RepID=A0A512IVA3_9HYPH|nr:NifU family protein [Methylobacterium haplocladii]GEP01630.1 iron transporter [Methylobacterium haplocladii]GJD85934.1 Fe/S biogenesis protein NfuA [Methylobacterium haplocladii]GLS59945.1 iron transporter [Methylobacterium haplocladii]